jgi:hypothetical protein
MRPLHKTVVAGAAATLVTTLGIPADAEELGAADGVRYKRSTVTVPASNGQPTHVRGAATCAKGWTAVGGGHTIGGGAGRGIAVGMKVSKRGWSAEAWQADKAASTLTTYAVCVRTGVSEEDQTENELPAGPLSVDQEGACPGGHVVSGGVTYFGGNANDFSLNSGYPVDDSSDQDTVPDDGWHGRVHYTGDGGDGVSVYLVCLGGKLPAYRKTAVTVAAGTTARSKAFCPHGRPVLGGGVRVSGPGGASHVINSRPIDSKDSGKVPDDGWLGAVTNTSDQDLKLTAHAVCR